MASKLKKAIKPVNKIKPPRWYNGEKFEYNKELKTKGKVVAFFEVNCGRYQGRRQMVKYLKVFENGMAVCVDTTMWKITVTQSIGTPFKLKVSSKRQFDKAMKFFLHETA